MLLEGAIERCSSLTIEVVRNGRSWGFSWELRVFIKLIKGLFAHERVHFNYVGTIFSTDVNLIKRGSFDDSGKSE